VKTFLAFIFIVSLGAFSAFCQSDAASSTLKGNVLDATGAGVGGASLTLTNTAKGTTFKTQSDATGGYILPLLPPGDYDLTVEAKSFQRAQIGGLHLTVGQVLPYDVKLTVGSVQNVIEVTAQPPTIQVEQAQQANTVNEQVIEGLPNVSRNFASSLFTLPGVASSSAPRTQNAGAFTGFTSSGFSIGGSNGRNNLVTIDGGENEYGDGDLRTPNISQESVQEFQMNRNSFAAEFGFTAGTALNVVTKSGSNSFHGSAYTYFLDEHTVARNYFSDVPGKPYEQHLFPGATLGGPLIKNKLFFFSSYEYRRLNTPQFRNYLDTPEAQGISANTAQNSYVNGLLASGNPYLAGFAAQIKPLLSPLNIPYVSTLLQNNSGVFDDDSDSHDWIMRVDYQPGTTDTLTMRFSIERYHYTDIGASSVTAPSNAGSTQRDDAAILATWNHIFSPSVVNTARVQIVPSNTSNLAGFNPNSVELSLGSLGVFDNYFGSPFTLDQKRFQFEDSVSWVKGKHNAKFGVSYRPVNYNVTNNLWFSGEFDFFDGAVPLISLAPAALQPLLAGYNLATGLPATGSPLTNLSAVQSFALGIPVGYRQGFNNPKWQSWANYLGMYAQDSWKVSHRLTIDYGLRFDYDAEPAPVPHNSYFSPRLGIAWDITGDQKTVLRAGSGIYVSPVFFQVPYLVNLLNDSGKYINQVAAQLSPTDETVPELFGLGLQEGKLPFGQIGAAELGLFGLTPGPGGTGRVIFNLAHNYKNNYSIQSSLSIAREITSNLSLEIGYLRYRGVHIPMSQETNYYETGTTVPNYGPLYAPINPTITQSNTYSSIGSSTYNALTSSLTKRYSKNFQFQANYTFSRAIDDVTDFNSQFSSFTPTRLYLERGLSAFNIKHNFVAAAVYTTRGPRWISGLLLSPIVTARSGIPFSVTVPGAQNGTVGHSLYARPIYIPRDSGVGPNFYSFDMRVSKAFVLKPESTARLEISVEGTNLLNHTNFLSVNNIFAFGDPRLNTGPFNFTGSKSISPGDPLGFTSASNARQFQFGLKLAF
jgi:hypothetical protein